MKVLSIPALTLCLLSFFALPASADFSGPYDELNWTQTLNGGSINLMLGNPNQISMTSSNGGGGASNTDFTIAALGSGTVSFNWSYSTLDVDGPLYDPFGYLLNGVFTQLTSNGGSDNQSGLASFAVVAGEVFGFRARSVDSILGSATTIISNYGGPEAYTPSAVPEPSTIVLLGSGLAGLVAWRKKRAA